MQILTCKLVCPCKYLMATWIQLDPHFPLCSCLRRCGRHMEAPTFLFLSLGSDWIPTETRKFYQFPFRSTRINQSILPLFTMESIIGIIWCYLQVFFGLLILCDCTKWIFLSRYVLYDMWPWYIINWLKVIIIHISRKCVHPMKLKKSIIIITNVCFWF